MIANHLINPNLETKAKLGYTFKMISEIPFSEL